ncbi:MAG: TIGR02302 family protein, partial [Nitratireductor sp.]|nr:TIGR02302 family protein [Nitratireductor sp.]
LGPGGGRIADAFTPRLDREEILSLFDAWINPPSYTRKPPVYLTGRQQAEGAIISVPQGSELFLRFVGNTGITAEYRQAGGTLALEPAEAEPSTAPQTASTTASPDPAKAVELSSKLTGSGTVVLMSRGEVLGEWPVEVVPDRAPSIRLTAEPSAALSGSLQLQYEVEDDYGVVSAKGTITPGTAPDPNARPLVGPPELPLSLPRQRATKGTAKVNRDLTEHPWAGSEVTLTLSATDDAGQTGSSEPKVMILPGRNFSKPLALALLEQRRILATDANKRRRVADLLKASMTAPEDFITVPGVYIAMNVAYRRIVSARDDDTLRSAVDLLWEIALAVEFGDLTQAERNLREAQERLSEALERGASDEEIEKLMDELREAMNEFIEQMMREAMQNPAQPSPLDQNQASRTLRQSDLERMMDQIENLARSGSKDAARELLSELQRMMDNLRAGRQQQQQMGNNPTNQALDKLSELMRKQQELMDESFRLQQQQNRRNQPGEQAPGQQPDGQQQGRQGQQGQQGEQGEMTPEQLAEALKRLREQQEALRGQLGELGKELEGLGLDPSKGFGEADREMGEAGENLGQGQPGEAAGDQGEALQALRDGVQQMMQQMAGQGQDGQQQGQGQPGPDRNRSDPLGRNQQAEGDNGLNDGEETGVPDVIDAQRAREIMEAIRKRLERPDGPLIEKRYLERLLETE